ncbi:LysR family transcriptional regulator [Chitinilyticum litopenaei]|uniref:LysR family transcriptional regulator n=1 Tax=Chitinilyticum litopenaei TaxID=1121276 RepID=UPI000429DC61|nr:LysR family transcriptional regulator [Chitinilyticum litopenaei]
MHDINDMLYFAAVVKEKSFSGAARRLDVSKSRVSKAIARLESALGVRLLHRSTRSLSLSEVGEAYFEHCERILDEVALADMTVSRLQQEPRGRLKISAPVAFSTMHVASALPGFMMQYPDLTVDLTLSDRFVDLAEEGYDIALRITAAPGQNLVARRLAPIRRKICASPAYLARAGVPQAPADLARHNCLDYTFLSTQGLWHLQSPQGQVAVPVSGSLRINDDEALSQAVLGGLGLALLPTFIVGRDLQAGRLVEVLPGVVPTEFFIYAVHLPNRQLPLKVRAFIAYLQEYFGAEPYWDREAA